MKIDECMGVMRLKDRVVYSEKTMRLSECDNVSE